MDVSAVDVTAFSRASDEDIARSPQENGEVCTMARIGREREYLTSLVCTKSHYAISRRDMESSEVWQHLQLQNSNTVAARCRNTSAE
jgi:hypothetical protein